MAALVVIALSVSTGMISSQKRRDQASKKKDPSGGATNTQSASPTAPGPSQNNLAHRELVLPSDPPARKIEHVLQYGAISLRFTDLTFVTPQDRRSSQPGRTILPAISGKIPAGKITGILGPTAW